MRGPNQRLLMLWLVPFTAACGSGGEDATGAPDPGATPVLDGGTDTPDPGPDTPDWTCRPADVPFPHAPGTPYLGVHANPQNNDLVGCRSAGAWVQDWHALQGRGIAQPNTFSPDGGTIYVTTSENPDGCSIHALDAATGTGRWCFQEPGALGGSVAVDGDGNLYATGFDGVLSLTPEGMLRWRRAYALLDGSPAGPTGLHLHPRGHVALVAANGDIALLDRATGDIVATLNVYDGSGLPRVVRPGLTVDFDALLPRAIADDFVDVFGTVDQLLAIFAGVGDQWSDNTVGIAPDGTLYGIGTGPDTSTGALVQVRVIEDGPALRLETGWIATFRDSSAASPSISPDGRWLKITDGNSTTGLLAPDTVEARVLIYDIPACDGNTDADPDPAACAPAWAQPLQSGPALGASPILNDAEHYVWEVQFADLFSQAVPDLIRFQGRDEVWRLDLPGDAVWSSVLTITENHIIGTATRFTPSEERLLTIALPATATSELMVIDRATGEPVFSAPVTDDSTSTVTIGPDGALYVTQLGLLHGFALDTRITGGIVRFAPARE